MLFLRKQSETLACLSCMKCLFIGSSSGLCLCLAWTDTNQELNSCLFNGTPTVGQGLSQTTTHGSWREILGDECGRQKSSVFTKLLQLLSCWSLRTAWRAVSMSAFSEIRKMSCGEVKSIVITVMIFENLGPCCYFTYMNPFPSHCRGWRRRCYYYQPHFIAEDSEA